MEKKLTVTIHMNSTQTLKNNLAAALLLPVGLAAASGIAAHRGGAGLAMVHGTEMVLVVFLNTAHGALS